MATSVLCAKKQYLNTVELSSVVLTNCVVIYVFHISVVAAHILIQMCHQLQLLTEDDVQLTCQMIPDPELTSWGCRGFQYTPSNSGQSKHTHMYQAVEWAKL